MNGQIHGAENSSQIINIVNQEKAELKAKEIQKIEKKQKIKKSERGDPKKEKTKGKEIGGNIDIYQ